MEMKLLQSDEEVTQGSLAGTLAKFVDAVDGMNSTIMFPYRLKDMELPPQNLQSLPSPPPPATSCEDTSGPTEAAVSDEFSSNSSSGRGTNTATRDLHELYTLINGARSHLLTGATTLTQDQEDTIEVIADGDPALCSSSSNYAQSAAAANIAGGVSVPHCSTSLSVRNSIEINHCLSTIQTPRNMTVIGATATPVPPATAALHLPLAQEDTNSSYYQSPRPSHLLSTTPSTVISQAQVYPPSVTTPRFTDPKSNGLQLPSQSTRSRFELWPVEDQDTSTIPVSRSSTAPRASSTSIVTETTTINDLADQETEVVRECRDTNSSSIHNVSFSQVQPTTKRESSDLYPERHQYSSCAPYQSISNYATSSTSGASSNTTASTVSTGVSGSLHRVASASSAWSSSLFSSTPAGTGAGEVGPHVALISRKSESDVLSLASSSSVDSGYGGGVAGQLHQTNPNGGGSLHDDDEQCPLPSPADEELDPNELIRKFQSHVQGLTQCLNKMKATAIDITTVYQKQLGIQPSLNPPLTPAPFTSSSSSAATTDSFGLGSLEFQHRRSCSFDKAASTPSSFFF